MKFLKIIRILYGTIQKNAVDLLFALVLLLLVVFCLHPDRFAVHYNYIDKQSIASELEPAYWPKINSCKLNSFESKKSTLLYPNENPKIDAQGLAQKYNVQIGGAWKPSDCKPLFNVAIILPYRNRLKQLSIFINYIHPYLQLQNLDYTIFVIEQSKNKEFNRGKLFNVGFTEAMKMRNFHCFIFQDIDLIPQNPENIYTCSRLPRHMSSSVNTFRYNLPYSGLFGGAISITKQQFQQVNGFSNVYFGWGGEDDDFYSRLQNKGYPICRFCPDVAQYYMLSHKKETPNKERFTYLKSGSKRYDTDGLRNLEYKVLDQKLEPLYSWFLVDI
ncbi:unnamed protein product [Trichogramma brassicae]|uniref:Beta-1,4-N-acetylgalactosaminyltransferase n=1 Tax=Trichogramma brassicae TaxID=86971 RepID=A0A6H5IJT7_9HYME|nr:unnamed protein product [Trichogramma brassicae]